MFIQINHGYIQNVHIKNYPQKFTKSCICINLSAANELIENIECTDFKNTGTRCL